MAGFCQIGPYKFALLNSPTAFEFDEAENWVEENRINLPPASQHMGRQLFTINIEWRLSTLWNADPEKTMLNLLDLKRSGEPIQLLQGNGTVWGKVKIMDLNYRIIQSRDGRPQIIEGGITVKEYKK